MKILFITPRLPYPLDRGDRVRVFNFAKVLSKEHSLSLVSLIQSEKEKDFKEELKKFFENINLVLIKPFKSNLNIVRYFFSGLPLQVAKFSSKAMEKKVEEILKKEKFDIIYVFHLRGAQYLENLNLRDGYKILDLTDSVSLFLERLLSHTKLYLKPILYRELITTKKYETEIIKTQRFNEYWFISTVDKEFLIKNISSVPKITVIPNGIDIEYFLPPEFREDSKELLFVTFLSIDALDAIFYFYKRIFPFTQKRIPTAKFHIIAKDAPQKLKIFKKDKNIILTDFQKDLRPYYQKAAVAVIPLRAAAGVQNKILEAMAMELPVVTTRICQQGVGASPGKEILVGDNPRQFAQEVIRLLEDKNLREKIGKNAREFVKRNFSWQKVADRINEIGFEINKIQ